MTMPLIISYNTPDPIYQAAADRLKRSLGKFKLSCEIICCTPRGAWIDNCAYKANFIYAMFKAYAPIDIVWLDADAEVVAYPEMLGELKSEIDVAAVMHRGHELLGSTLFFRGTPEVDSLLQSWIVANKAYPHRWDQVNLQEVLGTEPYKNLIKFEALPHSYAHIFDYIYDDGEVPIILQHQVSRNGRNLYP